METETVNITLTNTAPGIRGIQTANGLVYFKPNQSRAIEFENSEAGEAMAKRAHQRGFVAAKGNDAAEPAKPADDKPVDRDDLKKQAGELGLEYPKNIPTDKLKEMIDAKLAD